MATDYSKDIWDFFVAISGNEYGTAALMGNLQAESGLRPNNLQNDYEKILGYTDETYTAAVNNGSYNKGSFMYDEAGYGLAQWTYYSRKGQLYDFWKQTGLASIADIGLQCAFLYLELRDSYPHVWKAIANATNIRTPSDMVLHHFENPADQSQSVEVYRAGLGTAWYNKYASGAPVGPVQPPAPIRPRKKMSLLMMYQATRRRF